MLYIRYNDDACLGIESLRHTQHRPLTDASCSYAMAMATHSQSTPTNRAATYALVRLQLLEDIGLDGDLQAFQMSSEALLDIMMSTSAALVPIAAVI